MLLVQLSEHLQLLLLFGGCQLLVTQVLEFGLSRRLAGIAQRCPLIMGRQESGAPILDAAMGEGWADGHKAGKVLIFCPQSIGHPSSHARPYKTVTSRMKLEQRAAMGGIRSVHRVQKAKIIDALAYVREKFTHLNTHLPLGLEFPGRLQQLVGLRKLHPRLGKGQLFTIILLQLRLVIKRVDVGWASFHEQEDDSFCSGYKMRALRGQRVLAGGVTPINTRCHFVGEHGGHCEMTETQGASLEHRTSVNRRD